MKANIINVAKVFAVLGVVFSLAAAAETPDAFYNLVAQATGPDCATALANLTSQSLPFGQSATGAPVITDPTLIYTVAGESEATALCAQVGDNPSPLSGTLSDYQPSARPYFIMGTDDTNTTSLVDPGSQCAHNIAGNFFGTTVVVGGNCNSAN